MKHHLKAILKRTLCFLLYYTGLVALYRLLFPRRRLTILFFHQMDPDRFRFCLDHLRRHYHVISLADYLDFRRRRVAPPANSVVLTFDDGYQSNYLDNYPLLREYHFPAVIFLTAGFINTDQIFWWDKLNLAFQRTTQPAITFEGQTWPLATPAARAQAAGAIAEILKKIPDTQKNEKLAALLTSLDVSLADPPPACLPLTWDQARQMSRDGISLGAHTVTHPILTRIPLDQAAAEIASSKSLLEAQLNFSVPFFAYPNGEAADFNEDVKQGVRAAGFACALTAVRGYADLDSDLFALKRIPLKVDLTRPELAATLAGLWGRFSRQY
jgi:peptidoglycan/xylan/chitin deacetylase (PgdA/CDA1 family)